MSGTPSTTAAPVVPPRRWEVLERLTFPLRSPWQGPLPLAVALFLLFDIVLWTLLGAVRAAPFSTAIYLWVWTGCGIGALALLGRLGPRASGWTALLGTVSVLALLEEGLAYAVGGGLDGRATSLLDDWVRAVPSIIAMALVVAFLRRRSGAGPTEGFLAGALSGLLFEIGVARGASPLAFLVFGGAAAWTYGLLAGLPVELPLPGGRGAGAPVRWKGAWSERAVLEVGAFLALLAGLGAGALVAWATRT